ncbi:MAG: sugar transferase [Bacteroidales bacterium]|nr:sugar transferase [Bacteroidales bacterium]
MFKRLFDILFSILGLIILSPFFLIIAIAIPLNSRGNVFFKQSRVGKDNKDFFLIKFRTMQRDAEKSGFLTIGSDDKRVTKFGRLLRKYKLDELPQLFNILTGSMSIVGPRPEVRKYVDLYNDKQKRVLKIKPGLTDYASLEYIKESEILAEAQDPEQKYIDEIMPAKLKLNLLYINDMNFIIDMKIIFGTIFRIF